MCINFEGGGNECFYQMGLLQIQQELSSCIKVLKLQFSSLRNNL